VAPGCPGAAGVVGLVLAQAADVLPQHFKGRREDREIVLVPEADGDREAVGE